MHKNDVWQRIHIFPTPNIPSLLGTYMEYLIRYDGQNITLQTLQDPKQSEQHVVP